jgi:hypothetical protein
MKGKVVSLASLALAGLVATGCAATVTKIPSDEPAERESAGAAARNPEVGESRDPGQLVVAENTGAESASAEPNSGNGGANGPPTEKAGANACKSKYELHVATVNGDSSYWHELTFVFDPGSAEIHGAGTCIAGSETASNILYTVTNGVITELEFQSDYDELTYTWFPAFRLNADKSLTFVERDGDNVDSATGSWSASAVCPRYN